MRASLLETVSMRRWLDGHGGFMLAVGNMLNGGKLYGKHKDLEDLNYGRFQPVTTDFRTVFDRDGVVVLRRVAR